MKNILIDANIFLKYYDIRMQGKLEALDTIIKIKDKVFISQQLVDEVRRNQSNVFSKSCADFRDKVTIYNQMISDNFIGDGNKKLKIWNIEYKNLVKQLNAKSKELSLLLEEIYKKVIMLSDPVSTKLSQIFQNTDIHDHSQLEKARLRKELGNPPGKTKDPLGDQLTWVQFLDEIGNNKDCVRKVYIVTNDLDYCHIFNKKKYLDSFLQMELLNLTNEKLKCYCYDNLAEFVKFYQSEEELEHIIPEKLLDEIAYEEKHVYRLNDVNSRISSLTTYEPLREAAKIMRESFGLMSSVSSLSSILSPVQKAIRNSSYQKAGLELMLFGSMYKALRRPMLGHKYAFPSGYKSLSPTIIAKSGSRISKFTGPIKARRKIDK